MAFNRFNSGLGNLFGPTAGQGLQSLVTQQLDNMLAQSQPQMQTMQGLEALGFNPQEAGAMSGADMSMLQQLQPQQQRPQQVMQQQAITEEITPGLSNYQHNRIKELENKGKLSASEQKEIDSLYKYQQKQQEINEKKYQSYRDWYKPYQEAAKEAERTKGYYDQLARLAESGQLFSGAGKRLLDKIPGGDLVDNTATGVARKLVNSLKVTSSRLFPPGTKVTNFLEGISAGTIPGLEMNNDTIAAMSDLNALAQEEMEISEETARRLGKKWKGVLPWSADADFFEDIKPKLEKLRKKGDAIVDKVLSGKSYAKERAFAPGRVLGSDINEYANSIPDGLEVEDIDTGKKLRWNGNKKQWVPL